MVYFGKIFFSKWFSFWFIILNRYTGRFGWYEIGGNGKETKNDYDEKEKVVVKGVWSSEYLEVIKYVFIALD